MVLATENSMGLRTRLEFDHFGGGFVEDLVYVCVCVCVWVYVLRGI